MKLAKNHSSAFLETWTKGNSMKTKRADMAAAVIDGKIYAVCGLGMFMSEIFLNL